MPIWGITCDESLSIVDALIIAIEHRTKVMKSRMFLPTINNNEILEVNDNSNVIPAEVKVNIIAKLVVEKTYNHTMK